MSFSTSIFWVQVHELPDLWKSKSNLHKIGAIAGKVLELDFAGDGGDAWKRFIHIQVEFEVASLLVPGFFSS